MGCQRRLTSWCSGRTARRGPPPWPPCPRAWWRTGRSRSCSSVPRRRRPTAPADSTHLYLAGSDHPSYVALPRTPAMLLCTSPDALLLQTMTACVELQPEALARMKSPTLFPKSVQLFFFGLTLGRSCALVYSHVPAVVSSNKEAMKKTLGRNRAGTRPKIGNKISCQTLRLTPDEHEMCHQQGIA